MSSLGDGPRGFSPLRADEQNARGSKADRDNKRTEADPIESLFRYQPQSRTSVYSRISSATMAGVSPSGDSLYCSSRGSRVGAGAFMRSESSERLEDSGTASSGREEHHHHDRAPTTAAATTAASAASSRAAAADQHPVGPVDRLLLLVDDGQSLSRRVLGNERQSARLGERLSALKTPLWQLQARVRTQAERPPDFVRALTEQVSHCLDVLLELTHPDWWNQIRRKVRAEGDCDCDCDGRQAACRGHAKRLQNSIIATPKVCGLVHQVTEELCWQEKKCVL